MVFPAEIERGCADVQAAGPERKDCACAKVDDAGGGPGGRQDVEVGIEQDVAVYDAGVGTLEAETRAHAGDAGIESEEVSRDAGGECDGAGRAGSAQKQLAERDGEVEGDGLVIRSEVVVEDGDVAGGVGDAVVPIGGGTPVTVASDVPVAGHLGAREAR